MKSLGANRSRHLSDSCGPAAGPQEPICPLTPDPNTTYLLSPAINHYGTLDPHMHHFTPTSPVPVSPVALQPDCLVPLNNQLTTSNTFPRFQFPTQVEQSEYAQVGTLEGGMTHGGHHSLSTIVGVGSVGCWQQGCVAQTVSRTGTLTTSMSMGMGLGLGLAAPPMISSGTATISSAAAAKMNRLPASLLDQLERHLPLQRDGFSTLQFHRRSRGTKHARSESPGRIRNLVHSVQKLFAKSQSLEVSAAKGISGQGADSTKTTRRSKSKDRAKTEGTKRRPRPNLSGFWSSDDALEDEPTSPPAAGPVAVAYRNPLSMMTLGRAVSDSQAAPRHHTLQGYNTIATHSLKSSKSSGDLKPQVAVTLSVGAPVPPIASQPGDTALVKRGSWSTLTLSQARQVLQKGTATVNRTLLKSKSSHPELACNFLQVPLGDWSGTLGRGGVGGAGEIPCRRMRSGSYVKAMGDMEDSEESDSPPSPKPSPKTAARRQSYLKATQQSLSEQQPPPPPRKTFRKSSTIFGISLQKLGSCGGLKLEYPHTVPADGAVGVEVEGHQAFWMKPLTTVPPHTDSLVVFTKAIAGLVTDSSPPSQSLVTTPPLPIYAGALWGGLGSSAECLLLAAPGKLGDHLLLQEEPELNVSSETDPNLFSTLSLPPSCLPSLHEFSTNRSLDNLDCLVGHGDIQHWEPEGRLAHGCSTLGRRSSISQKQISRIHPEAIHPSTPSIHSTHTAMPQAPLQPHCRLPPYRAPLRAVGRRPQPRMGRLNLRVSFQVEQGYMCTTAYGQLDSHAVEALDLPMPTCFRSRSHSYLRAIQAGCSQDDDTASLTSDEPPTPPATTDGNNTCASYHLQIPVASYRLQIPVVSYRIQIPVTSYRLQIPVTAYRLQIPVASYRLQIPVTAYRLQTPIPVTTYWIQIPVTSYRLQIPVTAYRLQIPVASYRLQIPVTAYRLQTPVHTCDDLSAPDTCDDLPSPDTCDDLSAPDTCDDLLDPDTCVSYRLQIPVASYRLQIPVTSYQLQTPIPVTAYRLQTPVRPTSSRHLCVLPAPDTCGVLLDPDTCASYHLQIPVTSYHLQIPVTSYHLQIPVTSYHLQIPVTSYHLQIPVRPTGSRYLWRPTGSRYLWRPTGSRYLCVLPPPDTCDVLPPPDTCDVLPPPDTCASYRLQIPVASYWIQIPVASYWIQIPVASYWIQIPVASYWLQIPVTTYWLQIPVTSYHLQIPVASYHLQIPVRPTTSRYLYLCVLPAPDTCDDLPAPDTCDDLLAPDTCASYRLQIPVTSYHLQIPVPTYHLQIPVTTYWLQIPIPVTAYWIQIPVTAYWIQIPVTAYWLQIPVASYWIQIPVMAYLLQIPVYYKKTPPPVPPRSASKPLIAVTIQSSTESAQDTYLDSQDQRSEANSQSGRSNSSDSVTSSRTGSLAKGVKRPPLLPQAPVPAPREPPVPLPSARVSSPPPLTPLPIPEAKTVSITLTSEEPQAAPRRKLSSIGIQVDCVQPVLKVEQTPTTRFQSIGVQVEDGRPLSRFSSMASRQETTEAESQDQSDGKPLQNSTTCCTTQTPDSLENSAVDRTPRPLKASAIRSTSGSIPESLDPALDPSSLPPPDPSLQNSSSAGASGSVNGAAEQPGLAAAGACLRDGHWFLKLLQAETGRMEAWCQQMEQESKEKPLSEEAVCWVLGSTWPSAGYWALPGCLPGTGLYLAVCWVLGSTWPSAGYWALPGRLLGTGLYLAVCWVLGSTWPSAGYWALPGRLLGTGLYLAVCWVLGSTWPSAGYWALPGRLPGTGLYLAVCRALGSTWPSAGHWAPPTVVNVTALYCVSFIALAVTLVTSVLGKIRSAVGSAQLLMSQKFQQFRGLCEQNLDVTAQPRPTAQDLAGFWDLLQLSIEDISMKFDELHLLRSNDWKLPESSSKKEEKKQPAAATPKKVLKPKPTATKEKSGGESAADKQRQEARKRLMAAKRAVSERQNSATESADSIEIYVPEAQTRL
ncbi:hypothetical protein NFI96_016938 [Prochilodus magdalenae]|nr:hypothetical protein NFI96_016938 [Prochilodus magdalenae]